VGPTVSVKRFDEIVEAIATVRGAIPRVSDRRLIEQDIYARMNKLAEALLAIIQHNRQGPDWNRSFLLSPDDLNSVNEITIQHDLGYIPNRIIVVNKIAQTMQGVTKANWGSVRVISANEKSMTLQLSNSAATTNETSIWIIPYREGFVPLNADIQRSREFALSQFGESDSDDGTPVEGNVDLTGDLP